jgi:hypothetical protein
VKYGIHFLGAILSVLTLLLGGCGPGLERELEICPGAESVKEALLILKAKSEGVVGMKALGHLSYREGKKGKENFPVKLWVSPPSRIYFQGDKALDPKAIVGGANKKEFWLATRPGESTCIWGEWSAGDCLEELMISPKILLEALGIVELEYAKDWILTQEGAYDVLAKKDFQNKIVKKIYIYNCDNTICKIEYPGRSGRIAVSMELERYKEVCDGFSMPTLVKVVKYPGNGQKNFVNIDIKIKSVKPFKFTAKQKEFIFQRPDISRYKRVLKFNDECKLVEQSD